MAKKRIARKPKKAEPAKPKRFARLRHNWSWWDTAVGFFLGAFTGIVATLYLSDARWEAVNFLNEWVDQIIELFLIGFLLSRIIAVAKWPRNPPLDYSKITTAGAVAANFITMIMGMMLVIITLALVAPGVLELLAKHFGK